MYIRLRRISNLVRLDEGERGREREEEEGSSQPLSALLRVQYSKVVSIQVTVSK